VGSVLHQAAFGLASIASLTLISFTETNFLNPMDFQWFLVVLVTTKLLLGEEEPERAPLSQPDPERLQGRMDGEAWTFQPPER
jgi:hypothetical protein